MDSCLTREIQSMQVNSQYRGSRVETQISIGVTSSKFRATGRIQKTQKRLCGYLQDLAPRWQLKGTGHAKGMGMTYEAFHPL